MSGPTPAVNGPTPERAFELDAVVIGGCGHVGLPRAIALASRGATVTTFCDQAIAICARAAKPGGMVIYGL